MFKKMFPRKKQRWGLALIAGGLILVILGALWMTVLSPSMNVMQCDMDSITYETGTVTVLNTQALYSEGTIQYITYNVTLTREVEAVNCSGNTIYLSENVSMVDSDTGIPLTMLTSNTLMAIDRKTRMYVTNADPEHKNGYFCTPAGVTKDDVLDVWITGNPGTIKSYYTGEGNLDGLHVMYRAANTPEDGLTVPSTNTTPEMKVYAQYQSKCEPVTGEDVWASSSTTRTMLVNGNEITVYQDNLTFTHATTANMVQDAKNNKSKVILFGTTMPWVIIAIGLLEIVIGVWMSRRPKTIKHATANKK